MRRRLTLLLVLLILSSSCVPALAADDTAEESEPLLDAEELSAMIDEYRQMHNLNEKNFSVGYCYTGTGETWFYNGDAYFEAASLYKVPLMMCLAREISNGTLGPYDTIYGNKVETLLEHTLIYSRNETAEMTASYFDEGPGYRTLLHQLADIPEEELPKEYFKGNVFSARFFLNVLKKLYDSPESYPFVIDCMKQAQPGEYFRAKLENRYVVAQKYGAYEGIKNAVGIVYTPTPFLAVVMTQYAGDGLTVISDVSAMLAEYTLTLDQRLASRQEKQRAAITAEQERQAEEARKQAEEIAAEQARMEAEAAAREAAEKVAEEAAAKARAEQLLAYQQAEATITRWKIVCIIGISVLLILGAFLFAPEMKRK